MFCQFFSYLQFVNIFLKFFVGQNVNKFIHFTFKYFPTKSSLDGHNMAKHKLMTREIKRHNYAGSSGGTNPLIPNLDAIFDNKH